MATYVFHRFVHHDPFYSLYFCLELVHGMQSVMRQRKAMPVILPICAYVFALRAVDNFLSFGVLKNGKTGEI